MFCLARSCCVILISEEFGNLKGSDILKNQIEREFYYTLSREKKFIKCNNEIIPVFFRKNNDNNKEINYLKMYYATEEPIKQGNIINYNGKYFLCLNQETEENNVYKKSTLIETNSNLIINDTFIPAYVGELNAPLSTVGTVLSIMNGWIEIKIGDDDLSKNFKLNDIFNIIEGRYKITNLIRKNGIRYGYGERTIDDNPDKYTLLITDIPRIYNINEQVNLVAKVYKNDKIDTSEHNIIWSCADDNSTISTNGVVTILQGNYTTITAETTINNKIYKTSIVLSINSSDVEPDIPPEPIVTLQSISITTPPTKTIYNVGEVVNVTGMVVTATYSDNSTNIITDYTYSPTNALTITDTNITVTYNNKTAATPITVSEIVSNNTAVITGRNEIKLGYSRTYTASLTPVWSFEYEIPDMQNQLIITYPDANSCKIEAKEKDSIIGCTFTINLKDTDNTCSTSLVVTCISPS